MESEKQYSCERCNYTTKKISDLKKHLKKKVICEPICLDIDITNLMEKYYNNEDKMYSCDYCNKNFTSRSGKCHHKKICKKKKEIDEQNQILSITNNNNNINNSTINSNNINNNNIQIIINAFGKENMDYITNGQDYKQFMTQCINNQGTGLCEFLLKKHFSVEHGENHNIRKMNKKDMFIDCYDGKDWHPKIAHDFLYIFFLKLEKDFSAFMDTLKKQETDARKESLNAFMRKVGAPLEWNISNEYYDFDEDINEERSEKIKKNIYMLACEYIYRQSNALFLHP
jgi:hypothetical protein